MKTPARLITSGRRGTTLNLRPILTHEGLACRFVLRAKVRVAVSDRESPWMLAIVDTGATRTRVPEELFGPDSTLSDARAGESVLLMVADGRPIERPGVPGARPSRVIPTRRVDLVLAECLPHDTLDDLQAGEPPAARTVVTGAHNRGAIAPACWLCPTQMEGITRGSERDRQFTPPSVLLGMDFLSYWRLELDQSRAHFALTIPELVSLDQ